jgi:hypothetical protein
VARGSRAIASWSQTYGITDDDTPTPIPAASVTGSANEPHVRQQIDAAHGERERHRIARGAGRDRRERDDRQELDRRDGAQRQPLDRQVEAAVHHREHGAPRCDQPAVRAGQGPPRAA